MKRRFSYAAIAVGLVLSAAAPATIEAQFTGPALSLPTKAPATPIPTDDPALLEPPETDQQIGLGDMLTFRIFGEPEFVPTVKVNVDGTVQLPLIGIVHLSGLTIDQAEDAVADKLIAGGFYKRPQVTIEITAAVNQFATITGEVHAVVPLVGVRRLFDVLATGGAMNAGTSVNANIGSAILSGAAWPASASHVITIIRQGEAKPIVLNIGTDPAKIAAANIVIRPHDLIVISRVGVVYVVGAFTRQGAIPLDQNSPLTLLEATALSGGKGYEGRFEDLRIIRTDGLTRTVVKVNIKRIERGQDPDPILQADDIVFLPTNMLKATIKNGGIGTLIGLADIAVIALQR